MKKCTREHFGWILNVNRVSLNTKDECMKRSVEKSVIMFVSDEMQMRLNKPDFIELSVCLLLPGGSSS